MHGVTGFSTPAHMGHRLDLRRGPAAAHEAIDLNQLSFFEPGVATVGYMMNHPMYGGVNHDNNPVSLTMSEFAAMQATFAPYYPREVARLGAIFGRAQAATPREVDSATGARIMTYDSESAAAVERVLGALARNPKMKEILKDTAVVVSPPGRGLESIPGLDRIPGLAPALGEIEGVAMPQNHGGFVVPMQQTRSEGVAIRHDSLHRWDMGLVHELLHLLQFDLPQSDTDKIEAVYREVVGPTAPQDPSLDPGHLFVYLGQYYLSGYPEIVREVAPKVYALCEELIGEAPPPSRPANVQALKQAAQHIYGRYTS